MITFIANLVQEIGEALQSVIEFFMSFFEIITIGIQFIPQPFLNITLIFIPILTASIIYKIVKR